jgi:nucleolin
MKENFEIRNDEMMREMLSSQMSSNISQIDQDNLKDLTEILMSSTKLPGNRIIEMLNKRQEELNSTKADRSSEGMRDQYDDRENDVFVGNLPWRLDESEFTEEFSRFGNVLKSRIVTDRETGRSKGFGFITFSDKESCKRAVEDGNVQLQGRTVSVRHTEMRNNKSPRSSDSGDRAPNRTNSNDASSVPTNKIFVGNLSFRTTEENLNEFFSDCGGLISVRIPRDLDNRPRGFAFLEFDSAESASKAFQKNGMEFDGRSIRVDAAGQKQNPRSGNSSEGNNGFSRRRNDDYGDRGGYGRSEQGSRGGYSRGGYRSGSDSQRGRSRSGYDDDDYN